MKTARLLVITGLLTAVFAECKKENVAEAGVCQPPATLVAQAPCESGYSGVQLTASNYKDSDGSNQLIYSIYPQKDTLASDFTKAAYANASNERIIISETVIGNAPKFAVRVTVNCDGKDVPSQFFSFVKRPAANSGCYVWAVQKQP